VQLNIYGRGNNAYRWAGETDVGDVLDNFASIERELNRDLMLHPGKVVLRGFSMGGAGTWHLGLHRRTAGAFSARAGFTTTKGYVAKLGQLPAYQDACLHIYDAVDYAENAFNVPIVAYSGADDPQKPLPTTSRTCSRR
jgi:dienelactone hydrolase